MYTIAAFIIYCVFIACIHIWVWQGYRRVRRFAFALLTILMAVGYFFAYLLAVAFTDISIGKDTLAFGLFGIGLAMCAGTLFGGAIVIKRYPALRRRSVPIVVALNALVIMWSFPFIS